MLLQTALSAIVETASGRRRPIEPIRRIASPGNRKEGWSLMTIYAAWVRLQQGQKKTRAAKPHAPMLPSTAR